MTFSPDVPHPARRDAMPLWVVLLLLAFLLWRIYTVVLAPLLVRHAPARAGHSAAAASGPDTASIEGVLSTDLQAKLAFVAGLGHPGTVAQADPTSLRAALKSAETFQKNSHNQPGAARRVILLRAALGLPPFIVGKSGLDPRAAFTTALPAEVSPSEKARYAAEGQLWTAAFSGGRLSPKQIAARSAQISALPTLRWWRYPALAALYSAQGDKSEANRWTHQAQTRALPTLVPTIVLILLRGALFLLGLGLLFYLAVRAYQVRRATRSQSFQSVLPDLWPTLPPAIADSNRKLGAGDLMAVFVTYLLSREVLTVVLTGLSLGPLHLGGLLTPYRSQIRALSAADYATFNVVLESVTYLLSAAPPVLYLITMARQRGASLADEIGWNRRRFGSSLLFALGGFAIAQPLMIATSLLGARALRNAPAPSNPVIPQLINAPGFWTPLLLIVLASVAAPLVEELLFRGVFYNAVRPKLGPWPAIIVTGLVFGFVHPVGVAEMLAIAMLGGVFAWMAETRRSMLPGIFAHGLNNLLTTLLLLFALAS